MFDIKWIRENAQDFDRAMARRELEPQAGALIELDARRRDLQTKAQDIQAERTRPPLDMCPEIARIYIEDPAAVPFAPCRGCKYPLPGHIAVPDDGQRLTYFNLCPICGIPLTDTPETVNVTNNNTENS